MRYELSLKKLTGIYTLGVAKLRQRSVRCDDAKRRDVATCGAMRQ